MNVVRKQISPVIEVQDLLDRNIWFSRIIDNTLNKSTPIQRHKSMEYHILMA